MIKYELIIGNTFSPLYGDLITIPAGTLFWRGYDPMYPIISERPAYYSTKTVAEGYADPAKGYILGAFVTRKPLYIIDYRFLKVILSQLFQDSRDKYTIQDKNTLLYVQTSFGLCSLGHQIELMKHIYNDIDEIKPSISALENFFNINKLVEQPGVRIGETNIDSFTMYFLKGLFENATNIQIDGFVSPRLTSPFHIEKGGTMSPELILFNPSNASLVHFNSIDVPTNIPKITINNLLYSKGHPILTFSYNNFETELLIHGGGTTSEPSIEVFNRKLNKKDKVATKLYRLAINSGKRYAQKYPELVWLEPPGISINKSKFDLGMNKSMSFTIN
jgi:hypothetical protein